MNVTFLIGNGFDLRLGMKTRFADMYEGYIDQPSSSAAIASFKEMLAEDAPEYKTWGDFEMALAQRASCFKAEDDFIECLRDFKVYMAKHLTEEQKCFRKRLTVSMNAKSQCMSELSDGIRNFYKGLRPNVKNMFEGLGLNTDTHYHFITFNYTDVFDSFLASSLRTEDVIHIHGKLDADVVLGADNMRQLIDLPYKITKRFQRAFIKPEFNKSYDNARMAKASQIIGNSTIICIYGMSLGPSDYSWTTMLKDWLLADEDNHLVYFVHDEAVFDQLNWDAIMDEEEDRIASLLGKICDSGDEMDRIFDQIHVPVGYDIFAIDEILKNEKIAAEEEFKKKEELRKRLEERPVENGALAK